MSLICIRALSYARHALYNDCGGGNIAGFVHLTVASVSLELGSFSKAMDGFQKALSVAQSQQDNTLLLQVQIDLKYLSLYPISTKRSTVDSNLAWKRSGNCATSSCPKYLCLKTRSITSVCYQ